jgi:translation initiation factor 2B subunit (eIF-2B alpha/beta/delta family)
MLKPSMAAEIERIAADRESGAAELGVRAAEVLLGAGPEELAEAAWAVARAQPAMAPVFSAAQAALSGRLDEFLQRARRSSGTIARKAADLISGKVVLTHSFSSTVVRALHEGAPKRVVCTESIPGGEGHRTAALLNAELIPDAGVYMALAVADLVVVGADAITPYAVVNKIGTAAIALSAQARGKTAWVLCGCEKFVPSEWKPELGLLFEGTPLEWFTGVIDDS